jgi:peptidoglycan/xylan/chitin deacetylase (PgdA/CDA1 family)
MVSSTNSKLATLAVPHGASAGAARTNRTSDWRTEYSYTLVPTHDLDVMSVRELPWNGRTLWGVIYRGFALNLWKTLNRRIRLRAWLAGVRVASLIPLIKVRMAADPFASANHYMIELERRLGIRSTIYVMPFKNRPGHDSRGSAAPANRACFYDLAAHTAWFRALASDGWEIGVHGIDSHLDPHTARIEKHAVETMLGREVAGIRMHWLYHRGESTYQVLREAGYLYDATLGWNDAVGWPGEQYQPFRVHSGLWVLPLNIQDGGLLSDSRLGPPPGAAAAQVRKILDEAYARRAVVTILWHNQSFSAPRCWGEVYEWIIGQARADGARIMTAREVIEEYRAEQSGLPISGDVA